MTSPSTREIKDVDLFIDSYNRFDYQNTSSTNFRINIVNPIYAKVLLCGLKSVTLPNTINNVSGGSFEITDSVGNNNVVIPNGNYNLTQLITAIQLALNNLAVDTYTVTIVDSRFVITSSYNGFVINPNLASSSLLQMIGFVNGVSYVNTMGVITAPRIYDLVSKKNAFIKIDQITSFIRNVKDIKYNFKIDLSCPYGSIIYFSNESKYLQEYNVQKDNLIANTHFDIQLLDENGGLIDLQGADWNFTLKLTTQNLNQT